MAHTKKIKSKSTPKSLKKTAKISYDCEDVEKYLDRAITKVKHELIPRLELIDARDKFQYDSAKQIIIDANTIMSARQKHVEDSIVHMEESLDEIYKARKQMTDGLLSSFESLHKQFGELHAKLDTHIEDESGEFARIRDGLNRNAENVDAIKHTLDNVSANGNKGLSASFSDVYSKLKDLEVVTEGARSRAKFWAVLHDVVLTTPLLKPLKYKWGSIIYAAIILLIINTIVHALGVEWDLTAIFKWLFTLGKGG